MLSKKEREFLLNELERKVLERELTYLRKYVRRSHIGNPITPEVSKLLSERERRLRELRNRAPSNLYRNNMRFRLRRKALKAVNDLTLFAKVLSRDAQSLSDKIDEEFEFAVQVLKGSDVMGFFPRWRDVYRDARELELIKIAHEMVEQG